uniref:Replicase n=1 Tax=Grapevine rupestris stem pitting-associated virus TaxID=196400 RepID=A0A346CH95_9VIRU|nr:replicase [Grapevine rupestris stem pitting-associated virus]
MALSYRPAVEEVLAKFTSDEQSRVSATALKALVDIEEGQHSLFSFALSDRCKERLISSGIYLSPYSFKPHSHPVCKTLENHILYNVLPSYVNNSFYFVGIKDFKLQFLKRRNKDLSLIALINRFVTSKDISRYGSEFVISSSCKSHHIASKKGIGDSASLKRLIPRVISTGARNLFLHDEIHYWSAKDLITFLDVTRPSLLLATAVIPTELLVGSPESLNPWAYQYKISDDQLLFAPDGNWNEMYSQPLSCRYLLKARSVVLPDGSRYSVDLIHSKFCHHLLSLTPMGDLLTSNIRCFSGFDAIGIKDLEPLSRGMHSCFPVHHDVVTKIYLYLRTLKKPDRESAEAKLRQLIDNPTGREIKFIEDFSALVISCGRSGSLLMPNISKLVISFLCRMMPNALARLSSSFRETSLDSFVYALEPFNFSVNLIDVTPDFFEHLFLFSCLNELIEEDIEEVMDGSWFGLGNVYFNRQRAPYSLGVSHWLNSPFSVENKFAGAINHQILHVALALVPLPNDPSFKLAPREVDFALSSVRMALGITGQSRLFGFLVNDTLINEMQRRYKLKLAQHLKSLTWHFHFCGCQWFLLNRRINLRFLGDRKSSFADLDCNVAKIYRLVSAQATAPGVLLGLTKVYACCSNLQRKTNSFNVLEGKSCKSVQPSDAYFGETLVSHDQEGNVETSASNAPQLPDANIATSGSPPHEGQERQFVLGELKMVIGALSQPFEWIVKNVGFNDKLKGRSASFFAKPGIQSYNYNGGSHRSLGWPKFMDEILSSTGGRSYYNSCLVQRYEENSKLALHKDDENCYEIGHKVLTINLVGSATFTISKARNLVEGNNCSLVIRPGEFFEMPRGMQNNYFHGVSNCEDGRVSMTFRRQKLEDEDQVFISPQVPIEQKHEKLDRNMWQLGLHGIKKSISINGTSFSSDLCSCFSCHNFHKFKDLINNLKLALGAQGLGQCDRVVFATTGAGLSKLLDVPRSKKQSILVLEGALAMDTGYGPKVLGSFEVFKGDFNIKKIEDGSIFVISYRAPVRSPGKLRVHRTECSFSGSKEVLLGCQIEASADYDIDDFNKFSVPGDGNCFWHSVGFLLSTDGLALKAGIRSFVESESLADPALSTQTVLKQLGDNAYAENEMIALFCIRHHVRLIIITPEYEVSWKFGDSEWPLCGILCLQSNHFQPCAPLNGCMITAIASALGRREVDVLNYLCRPSTNHIFEELCQGGGLNMMYLAEAFEAFDICAKCDLNGEIEVINPSGRIPALFDITNEHIRHVEKIGNGPQSIKVDELRKVKRSALDLLSMNGSKITYFPSFERAEKLQGCLLGGLTGVISDEKFNDSKPWLSGISTSNIKSRELTVVLGTFGAGKSFLYKSFMKRSEGKFVTFVSPRRALANSIKRDLEMDDGCKVAKAGKSKREGWDVVTFEVFLRKIENLKAGHCVIFDEVQLFPPGYVDLCLLTIRSDAFISLAGDPCQSTYDSQKDRAILGAEQSDILRLLEGKSYRYNIESRRFVNPMFESRLPCHFKKGSMTAAFADYAIFHNMHDFLLARSKTPLDVILVSSFEEKKIVQSYFGMKQLTLTFGESTGLNFKHGGILISHDSFHTDDRRWLTALSRFSHNLDLVNITGISVEGFLSHFAGKPLYHFLTAKSGENVIRDLLPGEPNFFNGFSINIGKNEGVREEKLCGDPWLKVMLFLGQDEDCEVEELESECSNEEWFKTHIPLSNLESTRARWVGKMALKEHREVRCGYETTQQFFDEHRGGMGEQLSNACERFESIYPRHKGNDSITFLMAVRKRLKFSKPQVEAAKLRRAKPYGKFLLDTFLSKVPLNASHNVNMFHEAVQEFEAKKASKSAATIENHSGRSCRDWLLDVALIFMKSQHCTKFDNRLRVAKAGQTLACFQHAVLVRFAPYMRYIEKKLMQALKPNFYIHSGKGLDELNEWVKARGFTGVCTESDYEAFDASQDHFILAFELQIMRFLGLPEDLILDYEFIKIHLGSKLGSFAIMRFTGEASTFLFNTMANMLFTFLRYELTGSESIAFAGDDMCANRRLRLKIEHAGFLNMICLKAKVQFVTNPTFCGWCLFKEGIFKKPQLIWERICIAREMGNLENCIDNYAIEVSYAYRLGELSIGVMTEEEVEAHYNCVRFLVRNKHKMRCSISGLFEVIV